MSLSPGHRKWPDHKVEDKPITAHLKVEVGGEIIAETDDVVEVDEEGFPPRYYIPKSAIVMERLSDSNKPARCPFKGEGHYYNIHLGVKELEEVAWAYDQPFDEHQSLQGRVAFHDEMPGIDITLR